MPDNRSPFRVTKATEELLVSGYSQILRPKLVIGRFRARATRLNSRSEARNGSKRRWDCSMSMIVLCPY
jgi:hypothetical protein